MDGAFLASIITHCTYIMVDKKIDKIFQFSVSCNGFDPKSEKKVVPIMTFLVEEESSCLGQSKP